MPQLAEEQAKVAKASQVRDVVGKLFSLADLAKFDGSQSNLPIYLRCSHFSLVLALCLHFALMVLALCLHCACIVLAFCSHCAFIVTWCFHCRIVLSLSRCALQHLLCSTRLLCSPSSHAYFCWQQCGRTCARHDRLKQSFR